MVRNLIVLPDGTELFSGAGEVNAVKTVTVTQCVNDGEELTPGSAFANILEATLITPAGGLTLTAGDEVTLYKVDEAGNRTQAGVFTLEKPTRPTANTMKLTGYDHVAKLDKDLTGWLQGLDGWPYRLPAFARMVCAACGLTFVESQVPNGDFPVGQWYQTGVTGRQIMRWLGEICCRFVRATPAGDIEFGWYTPAEKTITPAGDPYILSGSLSYDTYQVAPVEAVQLRLADSADGALWPAAAEGANSYIITGNAILSSHVTEELLPYLEVIGAELAAVSYTPCKVSVPANLDIKAGHIVDITDKNGVTVTAYVMTKTTQGQRDTLECTGSPRRDSSAALYNKTDGQKAAEAALVAQEAVNRQTQQDIFNKLTNNGELQGLYLQDGKLYINAEYVKLLNLTADSITSGTLASRDPESKMVQAIFDLDNGFIYMDIMPAASGRWTMRNKLNGYGLDISTTDAADGSVVSQLHIQANPPFSILPTKIYDSDDPATAPGLWLYSNYDTQLGCENAPTSIQGSKISLGGNTAVSGALTVQGHALVPLYTFTVDGDIYDGVENNWSSIQAGPFMAYIQRGGYRAAAFGMRANDLYGTYFVFGYTGNTTRRLLSNGVWSTVAL